VLCGKARRSYGEQQQEQWGVALAGGVAAFMPIACVVAPYRRAPISLYPGVFFLLHSRSCEEGAIVALFCCPAGHNMCLTW